MHCSLVSPNSVLQYNITSLNRKNSDHFHPEQQHHPRWKKLPISTALATPAAEVACGQPCMEDGSSLPTQPSSTNLNKNSDQFQYRFSSAQQAQTKANALTTKLGPTHQTRKFNLQDHQPTTRLAVKHRTRKPMQEMQKPTITLKSNSYKLCTVGAETNANQHTPTLLTALMASSVNCLTPDF